MSEVESDDGDFDPMRSPVTETPRAEEEGESEGTADGPVSLTRGRRKRSAPLAYHRGASQADLDELDISDDGGPGSGSTAVKRVSSVKSLGLKGSAAGKKKCPLCNEWVPSAAKVCRDCDFSFGVKRRAQQDSIGATVAARQAFNFEPEREEDGNLKVSSAPSHPRPPPWPPLLTSRRIPSKICRIVARRVIGSGTDGLDESIVPSSSSSILLKFSHRKQDDSAEKSRWVYG
jgi:hypothetical protein